MSPNFLMAIAMDFRQNLLISTCMYTPHHIARVSLTKKSVERLKIAEAKRKIGEKSAQTSTEG